MGPYKKSQATAISGHRRQRSSCISRHRIYIQWKKDIDEVAKIYTNSLSLCLCVCLMHSYLCKLPESSIFLWILHLYHISSIWKTRPSRKSKKRTILNSIHLFSPKIRVLLKSKGKMNIGWTVGSICLNDFSESSLSY